MTAISSEVKPEHSTVNTYITISIYNNSGMTTCLSHPLAESTRLYQSEANAHQGPHQGH